MTTDLKTAAQEVLITDALLAELDEICTQPRLSLSEREAIEGAANVLRKARAALAATPSVAGDAKTALDEDETRELLDWVSACQSAYHIESTPNHRFGGLPGQLAENRAALVEYVNELIAARAASPSAAPPVAADPALAQAVDEALDLVTLPPIRVPTATHALLMRIADSRGLILQAVVREMLTPGEVAAPAPEPAGVPELPEATLTGEKSGLLFTADQVLTYGKQCVESGREQERALREAKETEAHCAEIAAGPPLGHPAWDESAAQPTAMPDAGVDWRAHVEQRIRGWRQRTMNKSGDMLAIDDFMGQESIDDLVDYVCDAWAEPGRQQGIAQAKAESAAASGAWQDLRKDLKEKGDAAYCQMAETLRRTECLGWEYKIKHGQFGEAELKAHTLAAEYLGMHRAFADAAKLIPPQPGQENA